MLITILGGEGTAANKRPCSPAMLGELWFRKGRQGSYRRQGNRCCDKSKVSDGLSSSILPGGQ